MSRMTLALLCILLSTPGFSSVVKAQIDGHYCKSKGVFAYQIVTTDMHGQSTNNLYVMHLNDTLVSTSSQLPAMEIVGIYCSNYMVVIQSQEKLYTYSLLAETGKIIKPKLIRQRKVPNGARVIATPTVLYWDHFPSLSVVALPSKSSLHNFELRFTYKSLVIRKGRGRVIYHQNMVELVTLHKKSGREKARQIVYDKTIEEPIRKMANRIKGPMGALFLNNQFDTRLIYASYI